MDDHEYEALLDAHLAAMNNRLRLLQEARDRGEVYTVEYWEHGRQEVVHFLSLVEAEAFVQTDIAVERFTTPEGIEVDI